MLLLLGVLAWRALRRRREAHLIRVAEQWRAALHQAARDPESARLPPIASRDLPDFVAMWNRTRQAAEGEVAERLVTLLSLHGIDDRLMRVLQSGSLRPRLIAITALGYLRERRAWGRLEKLARDPEPATSFAAARAMLRIEPRRALDVLSLAIPQRTDWSLARLGSVFQELGPAVVTASLVTMLLRRPRPGLERVVKLARFGQRERIASIVRGWLGSSSDSEVIIAALDYVEHRSDLPWALGAAQHAEWRVRMAAARALGRIGEREELQALLGLLRDPVWWVRYHAAQSLTRLRGLEPFELETLREDARDAFAADMLGQALAERSWR